MFTHADAITTSAAQWEPDEWHRVSIRLGSGDQPELSIVVIDLEPGASEARYDAHAGPDAAAVDRICFGLPGSAGGDLYIDDLAIR